MRESPHLARYLAIVYALLVIYASLYPFTGWNDAGLSPFAYLDERWPKRLYVFDFWVNTAGYLPLGFILAMAWRSLPGRYSGALLAIAAAASLSLLMEALQTYLPSRVPSLADLASNTAGGALGAVLATTLGEWLLRRQTPLRLRSLLAGDRKMVDFGLTLFALWLLTQLNPETLLFGNGDLRGYLGIEPALPYSAEALLRLEAGMIAANTLAIGILVASVFLAQAPAGALALLAIIGSVAAKTLAHAILMRPEDAFFWFTPGAMLGLPFGVLLLFAALRLPPWLRAAVAGLALMGATALVNLAPINPYLQSSLAVWHQGHFFNFNGATRLMCTLWPFLTLPYLMLLIRRGSDRL